ncbi:hypothetical protein HELRODRAFT_172709 [Helobdella robusta]|uniref:SAP domain-containing protein n=1 Tax=Helobdella robusta TaxID=6412 RepID=T1F5U1_HELRO|nr:hypothetical protein HELRODRAFT_172709 [Helobdella robusta]ESO04345.1 hypothetical protein HELRODRAFT_172709 [Helobdella robusta]
MTKLHQLNLEQLKEELQKQIVATSGKRRALIARLTKALANENKNPDEFEFDDQNVESNAVVDVGANTKLILRTISSEIKQQSTKIEQQSTEIKQTRNLIDAKIKQTREQFDTQIEQQSAAIDVKIKQRLRELREQFDSKVEQQLAVINAKMEEITSKIEQKSFQKVMGLDQKLSCEMTKKVIIIKFKIYQIIKNV